MKIKDLLSAAFVSMEIKDPIYSANVNQIDNDDFEVARKRSIEQKERKRKNKSK